MKKIAKNLGYIVIAVVLIAVAALVFTSPFKKDDVEVEVDPKTEYIEKRRGQAQKQYEEAKNDSTSVNTVDSAIRILTGY